jgi:hypothetical protein
MSVPELAPGGALRSLPASAGKSCPPHARRLAEDARHANAIRGLCRTPPLGNHGVRRPTALGADAGAPLRDPAFPPHTYPRELPRRRLNSRSPQEACPSLRGTPCRLTVATYGMT